MTDDSEMDGPLRSNRSFVLWATAEGVTLVGSSISLVVLPILVFQMTDSAAATAVLGVFAVAPYLVFGLLAGPMADRFDRKRMIVWGNLAEAVAMGAIPVAETAGALTVWHVYGAALVSATMFVFTDAAAFGALSQMVGTRRLAEANGRSPHLRPEPLARPRPPNGAHSLGDRDLRAVGSSSGHRARRGRRNRVLVTRHRPGWWKGAGWSDLRIRRLRDVDSAMAMEPGSESRFGVLPIYALTADA